MKRWRSGVVFLLACTLLSALGMLGAAALADSFDWRNVAGQDFVTPAKDQGGAGTCWAFAATGVLEAKYKLTRNDPTFDIDLSEQNLVCAGVRQHQRRVAQRLHELLHQHGHRHRGRASLHAAKHLAELALAERLAKPRRQVYRECE